MQNRDVRGLFEKSATTLPIIGMFVFLTLHLDESKTNGLGWNPTIDFETGLAETVAWYRAREDWWRPLRDREFDAYYRRQYAERGRA